MKSLRVNADYEVELFFQSTSPPVVNQSLEFVSFFLENAPIISQKNYSHTYLDYVKSVTGHTPAIVKKGDYVNWWGLLKDKEREKWWNSKITTTELMIQRGWCSKTRILKNIDDLDITSLDNDYLLKDPYGMSGQKFQVISKNSLLDVKIQTLDSGLKRGPIILEPWFRRVFDFSHYVFPNGQVIAYQNQVDDKFQYKGTTFKNHFQAAVTDLEFYHQISAKNWSDFSGQLADIISFFSLYPNEIGYSIDSFVYKENNELKIRVMSEVNYRRTMGRVAYELAKKFGANRPWASLEIFKPKPQTIPLWEILKADELKNDSSCGLLVLSPGDTRFDMVFFSSQTEKTGEELKKKVRSLLS